MRSVLVLLSLLLTTGVGLADENDAIALTVFDYMDGWYEGDAAKMERALHPDLAKRILGETGAGEARIEHMGAMRLVQLTRAGVGARTPEEERVKEVVILDVFGNAASVKAIMHGWIDYIHLSRIDGRWMIVNVLWELRDAG